MISSAADRQMKKPTVVYRILNTHVNLLSLISIYFNQLLLKSINIRGCQEISWYTTNCLHLKKEEKEKVYCY